MGEKIKNWLHDNKELLQVTIVSGIMGGVCVCIGHYTGYKDGFDASCMVTATLQRDGFLKMWDPSRGAEVDLKTFAEITNEFYKK